MFLRDLRITNLRSIENLELSFEQGKKDPRKWTLLLAENGTGKTTLLRAIALVTAGSNALGTLLGDIDSWIRLGKDKAAIQATLVTADGDTRHISLTFQRGDTLASMLERNRETVALLDAALNHAERNYFVVGYGASRRLAVTTGQPYFTHMAESLNPSSSRESAVATLFFNDATLFPLSTWIMQLDYQQRSLNTVKETLNHLLPGATFKRIDRKLGQVLFTTVDGEIPLERLSDGYQNVAAWCGDLLRRITDTFPDRKNPLKARGLLLIDEIDLHLHPLWQRKLIDFVDAQLPNFQIIATTHSPITAQQVGPGELIVMRRPTPEQPPQLDSFEGDPRLLRIDQLIASPIFGIETPLSRELELARKGHLEASVKPSSTKKTDQSKLKPSSRAALTGTPQGGSRRIMDGVLAPTIGQSSLELERVELLNKINAALKTDNKTTRSQK